MRKAVMARDVPVVDTARLATTIRDGKQRELDWRDKAVQPSWYGRTTAEVIAESPTLDGLSTPVMTLDLQMVDKNIIAMDRWCVAAGLSLAPHGKTTMAPELWRRQLEAGAWAITVANEPQLRVARGASVPRVIVANLFIRAEGLAWLSGELDSDDNFEFYCWVDSVDSVRLMDLALRAAKARRRVNVLVEVGAVHARTGARSHAAAMAVAEAVIAAPTLALSGVAGFEGVVAHDIDEESLVAIDEFLTRMANLHLALLPSFETAEPIISSGGSKYFDRVAAILAPLRGTGRGLGTRVVLRSGAYVVHDDGIYRSSTPYNRGAGPELHPAIHLWSRVISIPEPGIAYLDAGKRDLPFDSGLPELQYVRQRSASGEVDSVPLAGHELYKVNDQHAHVRLPADSSLQVGDVVKLGLSHPCTAFDKWSLIPVVDSASSPNPVLVDLLRTYF